MTTSLSSKFRHPRIAEARDAGSSPGFQVERLERSTWRVSDPEIDESDSRRIVGYIERLSLHHFEVMWLAPPISWAYLGTFKLALATISDRAVYGGNISDVRETVFVVNSTLTLRARRRRRFAQD